LDFWRDDFGMALEKRYLGFEIKSGAGKAFWLNKNLLK
jgi:hypothetical protein